ncbi:MAG: TonB-dependent receptor plug domain-containing protein [Gammaproteobacteria bacterium]|nr:TonB-dependent receptor plug domain-containing protein [Gammaproteobacteria bacterium]
MITIIGRRGAQSLDAHVPKGSPFSAMAKQQPDELGTAMIKRYPRPRAPPPAAALLPVSTPAISAEQGRQLEQIVVTAERRESTVQDTSISMSAFDANFIDNFNIRNPEDLQNYMPATVIQTYDASIRGVGRTFRTLGGDPGIATYLNDVYSEDFAIAATEGGLQDLARVEVLRGPQGTLYGRNAVGGAVNFITKRPTEQFEVDVEATAR